MGIMMQQPLVLDHAGAEPMEEEKAKRKAEEKAEEEIKEGCLLGFDFGEAEHDLYYSNIKEALATGDWRNIRFVEFQRVRSRHPCSLTDSMS
jgi:hypothetical protein